MMFSCCFFNFVNMVGKRSFAFEVRGPRKVVYGRFYDLEEAVDLAIALNLRTRHRFIVVRVDYEVIADFKSFTNKTYVQHLKEIQKCHKMTQKGLQ